MTHFRPIFLALLGVSVLGGALFVAQADKNNGTYIAPISEPTAVLIQNEKAISETTVVENEVDKTEIKENLITGQQLSLPPENASIAVTHISTPESVKAIYMSQCVAGTPSFRAKLVELIDTTELNSVVIDIRDYSGKIGFPTNNPELAHMVSDTCGARDMRAFIKSLHDKNIYVIGRITVFQNPVYATLHPEQAVQSALGGVWRDDKGLPFVDVGAKDYWDNVITLAKEAYLEVGFDELNFDYIRYPSDGPMSEAVYTWSGIRPKAEVLEEFFSYLHDGIKSLNVATSADLFGMVATNYDDLSIGQVLERALPYFDYISPMVYPSHYPPNWGGFSNPAARPYEVVHIAMKQAAARTKALGMDPQKIRPWLQDFNMGATYTAELVRAQIEATYDAGLTSWYLWDAGNTYTRAALKTE